MSLFIGIMLIALTGVSGQQDFSFGIGTWRSYFPNGEYTQMVHGTTSVIIANPFELTLYYPDTEEILTLNKKNGLSDIGIVKVAYMAEQDAIVVGYQNGNIDIVTPNKTYNLPGIKNNQNILSSKQINDIEVAGDQIYLGTDFGIVEVNSAIYEFGSTLFTDEAILHIERDYKDHTLYAASESELYSIPLTSTTNLADITQWNIAPPGAEGLIHDLEFWKNHLYLIIGDKLLKWVDHSLQEVMVTGSVPGYLKGTQEYLLVVNEFSNIFTWDGQQSVQHISKCLVTLRDVLLIDPETFWYLKKEEFGKFSGKECKPVGLPGVPSRFVTEMTVMEGDLYVATGGVSRIYNNLFREDGFYTNESGEWITYSNTTIPELAERNMRDVYTIQKDAETGVVYFGTFWDGVIRFDQGSLTIFDETNSSLGFSVTNPDRIRVSDLFLDQSKNLWVANHDAIRPLSVMTPEKDWQNFSIPTTPRIEKLVVDQYQNIWMAIAERGLLIFNPGDWTRDQDDASRLIIPKPGDGSGTGFDNARINEIVLDKNGAVWLGTESGPVIFDCGNIPFQDICQGRKPVIELNGQLGVLLGNENIKAIAIDGGNRKWFGTDNGIYVVSASLDQIDHHFNVTNSPLPHNSITDIAIDPESGEVYVATDQGLVSYRGEATEANPGSFEKLTVYPNPVAPDYKGRIGIKNLAENALVRITTLSGRLIYENRATGGQLVWDRRDQDGQQVSSGIYLVFSTHDQSLTPYTEVGKIFLLD